MTATTEALARVSDTERAELSKLLYPRLTKYIPHLPEAKQAIFLRLPHREAFYGGAGGGGKSEGLLMGALQHVDVPGYAALLFRRTYQQLTLPEGLITRSHEWLAHTDAHWNGERKEWRFPSGAVVRFGHMQYEQSKHEYQGGAYQYIAYDELTAFTESQYRFLFGWLRRKEGVDVPLRMRSGSNPGGLGHFWVRDYFNLPHGRAERPFIPASIEDNPHLDRESYRESLSYMDPITRLQIESGDWTARASGGFFRTDQIEVVDRVPPHSTHVRYWDLAATDEADVYASARTAGIRMAVDRDGVFYIVHSETARKAPGPRDRLIEQVTKIDGRDVEVWIEQEPGSGGKHQAYYLGTRLAGFTVNALRPTGDKVVRAGPLASQVEFGNVRIVRGEWNHEFLDELDAFPGAAVKDQVDAASGAFEVLTEHSYSPTW